MKIIHEPAVCEVEGKSGEPYGDDPGHTIHVRELLASFGQDPDVPLEVGLKGEIFRYFGERGIGIRIAYDDGDECTMVLGIEQLARLGMRVATRARARRLRGEDVADAWKFEGIRTEVLAFAARMEKKLRYRDDRGDSWKSEGDDYLLERLEEESLELNDSIRKGSSADRIIMEAADVANFAMMIAHNHGMQVATDGGA